MNYFSPSPPLNFIPQNTPFTPFTPGPLSIDVSNITSDNLLSASEIQSPSTTVVGYTMGATLGDQVTLTINGTAYTGQILTSGRFCIDVPTSALVSNASREIKASVTTFDAQQNVYTATASKTYAVDAPVRFPSITLNNITADNIVNAAEAKASLYVTGSTVGTTIGNVVTLEIGTAVYRATTDADGNFSIKVAGSVLASSSEKIIVASVISDKTGLGAMKATAEKSYFVDKVAPTATISMSDANLTAGETSVVTIKFSEAVTAFGADMLKIAGGTLTPLIQQDALTWQAVFTPASNLKTAATIVLKGGYADAAGNIAADIKGQSYSIDTLIKTFHGTAKADKLVGTSRMDIFKFETGTAGIGPKRDVIKDFSTSNGDLVDLTAYDANSSKDASGNQHFNYIGGDKFSGVAGELRFEKSILSGDTNGDGKADFEIEVVLTGVGPDFGSHNLAL